jgi:hypothetical protein
MPSGVGQSRRTKSEAIRGLFKAAIKAITPRDPDAPPTRRRSGKKGGGGMIMLRQFARPGSPAARGRYAGLQPVRASIVPEELLHTGSEWDVFDITGVAYEHGFDSGGAAEFNTVTDHLSPGL